MNQKNSSDSVIPGPGFAFPAVRFNRSGVTFLTRNPTTGSAGPVVRYWIPASAGMTWLSIVFNMTDY